MANSKKPRGVAAYIPLDTEQMEAVRLDPDAFIVEPLPPWEDKIEPRSSRRGVKPKISRKVEWRSEDGETVVVAGPFPQGLSRSETRKTVDKAAALNPRHIWKRDATSRDTEYAKVRAKDVNEVGGENEFGTISP